MELLVRESDGFFRTPSGLWAVIPKMASGNASGTSWFEFKTSALSEVIRVEWPQGSALAIFDAQTSKAMIERGYARNITQEIADAYNQFAGEHNALDGVPASDVDSAPAPARRGRKPGRPAKDAEDGDDVPVE